MFSQGTKVILKFKKKNKPQRKQKSILLITMTYAYFNMTHILLQRSQVYSYCLCVLPELDPLIPETGRTFWKPSAELSFHHIPMTQKLEKRKEILSYSMDFLKVHLHN